MMCKLPSRLPPVAEEPLCKVLEEAKRNDAPDGANLEEASLEPALPVEGGGAPIAASLGHVVTSSLETDL
jgi:hypothetical protein